MLDTRQFTGSETMYRNPFGGIYTEGIKYVADTAQCYWLVDDIFIYQTLPDVKKEAFQVWILRVDLEKSSGVLTCEDGNGNIVFTTNIPFTTFPDPEIKLWFTDKTLLLPSEY